MNSEHNFYTTNMASDEKWSLEGPCRLCADLCSRNNHVFSDDKTFLVDLIKKYLSIKISINDTLPIHVCESCRLKVISFNEYALKCVDTQIALLSATETFMEIPIDDLFSDTVKTEDNYIKNETIVHSIKSENDTDNFSDDLVLVTKTRKKKSSLKALKIKDEQKKARKQSLRKKKQARKSSPDLSNNEGNVEHDVVIANKRRKKVRSSAINSSFIKFICHICNEEFLHWEILQKHTNQKHEVKPKILCVCDQYLSSKNTIYKHIKMHDSNSFTHKCTECDNTFYTKPNLKKHYLLEHSNMTRPEHKCEQCGKIYPKLYLLKQHELQHLPKEVRNIHPCEICGAKFASKMAVQIHNKHVHIKDKSFVCDICGKFFTSNGNLNSHRVVHSGDRPFLCPHCPKTFRSSFTLKCHSNIHNDVVYKCSKCPSTFSYANTLREHMNVHTDVCRFTCGFCNKGFKWKRSFEAHLNIHTGKTPFSCPWCSKTFADGSNCRIHKRRAHPVELAEYEASKGISNQKIKRGPSTETTTIRSIQFADVVKPQVFPKLDLLNSIKSDNDSN